MQTPDALAFIKALTYREVTEGVAAAASSGNVIELCYSSDLQWPWPREFTYRREYLAVADASEVATVIDREHEIVVNLFHPDLTSQEAVLQDLGLTRAWINPIMGRDLAQPWPRPVPVRSGVREVRSGEDRNRFNSLPGISNRSDVIDDRIHYLFF